MVAEAHGGAHGLAGELLLDGFILLGAACSMSPSCWRSRCS